MTFHRRHWRTCRRGAAHVLGDAGRWLLFCSVAFIVSACAGWQGQPVEVQYDSEATRQLLERTLNANQDLSAFKGIGRVTVETKDGIHIFDRTVWVGSSPGRLRFAFRSPAGMPVFSMSCNEQLVTALNHGNGKYFRREIGDNSLPYFLPVDIKCADLFGLLAARPPHVPFDYVGRDAEAVDNETISLVLRRRFRGTVARIRIDPSSGDLRAAEMMDVHGNRRYEATVDDFRIVDGYRLPARIQLAGPEGRIKLDVKRIWPETAVDPDLFQINPPEAD
jgi:hypothetical protein